MELIHEFTYNATLDEPLFVGEVPFGTRVVYTVNGGEAKGDRISGKFGGAGADWILVGSDGFGRLDVRGQILTDDGAVIYLQYTGLLEMNDKVGAAQAGGGTDYDDHYFRTTPRLECGDPRYAWVNTTVFVARGRLIERGVEYEVFRVA